METLLNLCRCCLSPNSDVSLFDTDLNVKVKFFETTSVEVKIEDGLPQKLCINCFTVMNTAYQFRTQCIKMDKELKIQLDTVAQQKVLNRTFYDSSEIRLKSNSNKVDKVLDNDVDFANDPMKQLEAIIKQEPNDSDDDCYYVLVINDPKDNTEKEKETKPITVKKEPEVVHVSFADTKESLAFDPFLVTEPKVSDNVPATILENEEEDEDDNHFDDAMNIDEDNGEEMNIEPEVLLHDDDIINNEDDEVETIGGNLSTLSESRNSRLIEILSAAETDGKIILKGADDMSYEFDNDDDDPNQEEDEEEEVIVYEEGEESQFQIVNCDGDLVIEYADDSQVATVYQQEDGTFLCDCGEQCEDIESYEKHQYTHSTLEEHLCNLCGKGFESPEILTGHMLLHKVSSLLIMCPFCDQLIRRNTLTQHIKYGHNKIKPSCKVCMKTFANPNNLKRHMMIHSGLRQFECDICFKRFHQKITMQTHRLTHIDPFSCTQCDSSFRDKMELDDHMKSNQCTKSKVTRIRDELIKTVKQEITTQQGTLLAYACSLCKKMFSVEEALDQHVEKAHMRDPMELICKDCGEVLPSKKDMHSHMQSHKNVRSKNVRRFECSVCSKGCSSQAMLVMHERVHTNERPFPCQLCALRFKTKTHLRTHQLTHTREKKFGCSVCLKFFALKGNLVVHLRTHTGERPYVCNLCNDAFIDSKYLKKHKLKKHAIENLPWNEY